VAFHIEQMVDEAIYERVCGGSREYDDTGDDRR